MRYKRRTTKKRLVAKGVSAAILISLILNIPFYGHWFEGERAVAATDVTYNAIVGFQTYNKYDFRNGFEQQEADARYGEWLVQNGKEAAPAGYNGINIYRNGNGPEIYEKGVKKGQLKVDKAEKAELCRGAIVQDAVIDKDGKYTVSIKNLDLQKDADEKQTFSMLDVSTNIVKNSVNNNVTAKAISVKINGEEIAKDIDLPVKADIADGAYYKFMLANGYSIGDKTANVKFPQLSDADASTGLAVPSGLINIEITFELKGVCWTDDTSTSELGKASPIPADGTGNKEKMQTQLPATTPSSTMETAGGSISKGTVFIKNLKAGSGYKKTSGYFYKKVVKLSWDQAEKADGFYIYRKAGISGEKKIADISIGDAMEYTDSSVKMGESYTYRVLPYVVQKNGELTAGISSSKVTVKIGTMLKKPMAKIKTSGKRMTLTFSTVEGDTYETQYRWIGEKKWKKQNKIKGKIKKKIIKSLNAKGFSLRVRTYTVINGHKVYSKWSAPIKVK